MKILIINHYFGSTELGMEYRHYYLAKEFKKVGHEVAIVASKFSHLRREQPKHQNISTWTEHSGFPILWLAGREYSGNGFSRLLNMIEFSLDLWRNSKKISSTFKPDVVYATSPHPFCSYGASRIATLSQAKFIFEIRDLWPLSIIELGSISVKHPLITLLDHAENFGCRKADKIISLLPNVHEYMQSRNAEKKWTWIPNGIDISEWKNTNSQLSIDLENELAKDKKNNYFIVGYAGSHGIPNALDNLLNAAAQMKDKPISFFLVGNGHERERLLFRVKNENLHNVKMFDAIPKSQIPTFLKKIDVGYLGAPKSPIYRFGVSPNKMIDYMMAEIPIIYSIESGNHPVNDANCGIEVFAEDHNALVNGINKLVNDPSLGEMGKNGKKYALSNLTYPMLAEKFIGIIQTT